MFFYLFNTEISMYYQFLTDLQITYFKDNNVINRLSSIVLTYCTFDVQKPDLRES